ncbi:hypothetical protein C0993_010470 [Termitomyces sp. T159_Od127]|nr:hypothetical protein C0993_010470 [Termitomyces sp. T159_Od127]
MACLPEELLERILAHAIPPPRPLWLRSPSASTARLAALSVSRQFHRIAAPLLYRCVHLTSPSTADLLLRTLCARPEYAQHIRELAILGLWSPVVAVLRLCPAISSLDLTIAFEDGADVDLGVFAALTEMRHLTLRKPPSVYLSLARPRALITSLARAITAWPRLSTATIAFKLSDDTPTSPTSSFHPFSAFSASAPPSGPSGPITALATALAAAPALHTFSTHLPSVWNASIASVASNPALERICLYPASSRPDAAPGPAAIPGTGLFLMEARRHPRLAELIAAGTPIIRSRAHTLGSAAAAAAAAAPAPATTTTTTTTQQQKPAIGLGLRIDTSAEAISGAEAPASRRYRSGVAGHANASGSGSGGINPAWMGPVRTPSSAGGKGKGRRV